jgi:hypothetical protein
MYDYETLQERTRERRERLTHEAGIERLAREARGRRRRRRQRLAYAAGLGLLLRQRRRAGGLQDAT